MANTRFFVIQDVDVDNSTGSALFSGSPVYGLARDIKVAGENSLAANNKSMLNPDVDEDDGHIGSNWSRRSADVSYNGTNKPVITLSGGWTAGSLSNSVPTLTADGEYFLTPHKFLRIARSGRPFYVKDEYMIPAFIDGDTGLEDAYWSGEQLTGSAYEVGSSYYGKHGIKSTVKAYNMSNSKTDENYLTWKLTMWEDKE